MFLCLWQKRRLKESFFWHKGVIDNHNLQRKNVPVHHFIPWIFLSPFSVTNKNPVCFQFSWSPTVACFITSLFMTEPNHNYLKAESLILWYQVSDSHSWPICLINTARIWSVCNVWTCLVIFVWYDIESYMIIRITV